MGYRYECNQCHMPIGGKGLDKHHGSKRCNDMRLSYMGGYLAGRKAAAGKMRTVVNLQAEEEGAI